MGPFFCSSATSNFQILNMVATKNLKRSFVVPFFMVDFSPRDMCYAQMQEDIRSGKKSWIYRVLVVLTFSLFLPHTEIMYVLVYIEIYGHVSKYLLVTYLAFFQTNTGSSILTVPFKWNSPCQVRVCLFYLKLNKVPGL